MSEHNTWTIPEPKADYIVLNEEEYNRRLGELEELRAELARLREQQWEPLTVGGTLSIDNATMAVSSHTLSVIYDAGGDVEVMTWNLPASIRLCRRNPDAQPDA